MSAGVGHQQHQFAVISSCLALLDEVFHTASFIDPAVFDVVNSLVHARLCLSLLSYGGYPTQQADGLTDLVKHLNILYRNCQLGHILLCFYVIQCGCNGECLFIANVSLD